MRVVLINMLTLIILFITLCGCKENETGTPIKKNVEKPRPVEAKKSRQKEPEMEISVDYLMGRFDPENHKDFARIPESLADREGMLMRKEALVDFKRMHEAAGKDGVKLVIKSATRNFDYQKDIWERKWTGKTTLSDGTNAHTDITNDISRAIKILEYNSMPSTSRHHWGTDIDLNAFDNSWFESGDGLKLFDWLESHAADYGFCRPYTTKGNQRPHGYNEEKWHWSYIPLSSQMTQYAMDHMNDENISGFKGASTATTIDVINRYVLGIDESCK